MDVTFYHPKTWINMETEVRTLDRERPNLQCVSSDAQSFVFDRSGTNHCCSTSLNVSLRLCLTGNAA